MPLRAYYPVHRGSVQHINLYGQFDVAMNTRLDLP